jgi:hypothetical protein
MTITLSNIRFSGKLRAELGPLVPKVTVTFVTASNNCHFRNCSHTTAVDVAVAITVACTSTLMLSQDVRLLLLMVASCASTKCVDTLVALAAPAFSRVTLTVTQCAYSK